MMLGSMRVKAAAAGSSKAAARQQQRAPVVASSSSSSALVSGSVAPRNAHAHAPAQRRRSRPP
jgi:hypothetical protein